MSIEKIRKSVLVVAGIAVIAAAGLFAGRLSAGAFHREKARGDFAQHLFSRMSRALDLTEDQKSRIKDVLRTHADQIKAQMQASATARRALHDAVMAQPTNEDAIRSAAAQVGQTQADGALLFARIRTEIDPILTSEQKQKIQSFQTRVRHPADAAGRSFDRFLKSGS
jgi:Spy/CpxP family protein refolding chaperone